MDTLRAIFDAIWTYLTSRAGFDILIAFVAGGYLTTWMGERWQRRREQTALMHERTSALVHAYQRYVRLLRKPPDRRSESELDFAHSAFMADIRILGFDSRFADEAAQLRVMAQKMVNIANNQNPDGTLKSKLNELYKEFDELIKAILDKI